MAALRNLTLCLILLGCISILAETPSTPYLILNHPDLCLAQSTQPGFQDSSANDPAPTDSVSPADKVNPVPAIPLDSTPPKITDIPSTKPAGITTSKKRFFQSVLIPGWGQLSNKSYIMSGVFVGIEALAIFMAIDYNKKGHDKEDEYEAYADQHYRPDVYLAWLEAYKPIYFYHSRLDSLPPKFTHDWETEGFKSQQYYEMIGKYDQFYVGWDDGKLDTTGAVYHIGDAINYGDHNYTSENALTYMDIRHKSNQNFDRAKTFIALIAVNHLAGGIEAAWKASRLDKKLEQKTGLKDTHFQLVCQSDPYRNDIQPSLTFTARF